MLAGTENSDGVVWTPGGKLTLPRLPALLPSDPVFPNAVSGDGALVFGGQGSAFFGTPTAFVWSEAGGLREVATLATDAGFALPDNVQLTNVLGVSADGTVLIGTASNVADFSASVWAMRLPTAPT